MIVSINDYIDIKYMSLLVSYENFCSSCAMRQGSQTVLYGITKIHQICNSLGYNLLLNIYIPYHIGKFSAWR